MSILSDAQIVALWLMEGGSLTSAPDAVARALSESSGSTNVTSGNPDGGTNVGLYQLDTKGVGAGYSVEQLSDPYTNTRITVQATKNGADWAEWADNWTEFTGQATSAVSSFQAKTNTFVGGQTAYIKSLLSGVTGAGAGGAGASPGASSGAAGGASTKATSAQSVLDTSTGVVGDASALLHGAAESLNFFWEFFQPGQGWRLAFGAGAIALGYFGLRQWGLVPSVSSAAKAV